MPATMPPTMLNVWSDPADGLANLTRSEHLLVWALRAIALGREDCPVVVKTFRGCCGRRGDEVLQAYGIFVKYAAMTARKRLQVHAPGCPCVGHDELAVVAVLAAAQRAQDDADAQPLRERLEILTGRSADESLLQVACSIARLLEATGLRLPLRPEEIPPDEIPPDEVPPEAAASGWPPPRLVN